ncbi:MAG: methyltransferase [Deltaproteobacteria bacterium]|nr:methyltransferase [Candidatus Anaeroferrophillacea bacterium]
MTEAEFYHLKAAFLEIAAALEDLAGDPESGDPGHVYREHLQRIDRLAARPVAAKTADRLAREPALLPVIARIARLKREAGLRLECRQAEAIAAADRPWSRLLQFPYYANYLELARMERRGAGLESCDRVVFLGSGPLPLSLICLNRQYRIRGTGIERDGERTALARRVIKSLGLADEISILCGSHFDLPLKEPVKLVMVGADARPKDEIFAHLAAAMRPGEMLSWRIYEKGLRRLLDDASRLDPPAAFTEIGRVHPEPPVNNTAVFAVRNDSSISGSFKPAAR